VARTNDAGHDAKYRELKGQWAPTGVDLSQTAASTSGPVAAGGSRYGRRNKSMNGPREVPAIAETICLRTHGTFAAVASP
jgi:hypothetical protein